MPPIANTETPAYITPPVDKVQEAQPIVVPKRYRSNIIDTRYLPTADILTHIEGSPWTINYFSQVAGLDDELAPPQPDQSGAMQQYIQINNLEIRVESDLSQSQDPETNEMIVSGSAMTFPFFIPNVNDVFFADIGNGREGAFLVTESEAKTIFSETTYRIEYMLMSDTAYGDLKRSLESKVVKTYFFDKNFLQRGKNPMLVAEEFATLAELKRQQNIMLDIFLSEFYDEALRTIALRVDGKTVYDPMLLKMIQNLTDITQHPLLRRLKTYNTDDGYALNDATLWDVILRMDDGRINTIHERVWAVVSTVFARHPMLRGIYHSPINIVVYPLGMAPFITDGCLPSGQDPYAINDPLLQDEIRKYILNGLGDFIPHPTGYIEADILADPPLIHPVRKDDYYVLSKSFYEDWEIGQSHLELLTRRAISKEAFSTGKLVELCKAAKNWEPLDRFYYIPVILALLKAAIQRL